MSSVDAVIVPRGEWTLLRSHTGGTVEYQMSEGVTTETGSAVTKEHAHKVGVSIRHMIQAESHFIFGGVKSETEIEVGYEHSWSVAEEISQSTSKDSSETTTVKCDAPEAQRSKVWLYQFVVQQGHNLVKTSHTRCHYTAGNEHPPECPLGACGKENEWCQAEKCSKWMRARRLHESAPSVVWV